MPCDYKNNYPANWKTEIRPAILERDGNCCKFCGVKNYEVGYWGKDKKFWTAEECLNTLEDTGHDVFAKGNELDHIPIEKKPVKVVLTIMHLDHDITNNDYSNLAAGCQRCHLNHDREFHRTNSKETNRKKKGLQNLF